MSQQPTNLLLKKPKSTRTQIFNVKVSEEESIRLLKLAKKVQPSNKAEVFRLAIRVLENLAHELDDGSELYIKRTNDETPVKFDILKEE